MTFLGEGSYKKPKAPEAAAWMDCIFGIGCWPKPELLANWPSLIKNSGLPTEKINAYVRKLNRLAEVLYAVADGLFYPDEEFTEKVDPKQVEEQMQEIYEVSDRRQNEALFSFLQKIDLHSGIDL